MESWVLPIILKRLKSEQTKLMVVTKALPFQKASMTTSNSKWLLRMMKSNLWMLQSSLTKPLIQLISLVDLVVSLSLSSLASKISIPRVGHRWAAETKRREALRKASALESSLAVWAEAAVQVFRVRDLWMINVRIMKVQGKIPSKPLRSMI